MAWNTPRTWITGEVLTKANLDAQVRDNLAFLKVNIALEAAVELTISSGAVTKSRSHHTIDTEGDAASDNLDTISGGSEGEILLLRPASGSRAVTVRHNAGNIWNRQEKDVLLDHADDYVILVYSGNKWGVLGGSGSIDVSGTPDAQDYTRFTDNDTVEGRSVAEVRSDLGVLESIDEDSFASNSDTKVPTQQSTKAYVDNQISVVAGPDFDAGEVTDPNNTVFIFDLGGV